MIPRNVSVVKSYEKHINSYKNNKLSPKNQKEQNICCCSDNQRSTVKT